MERVSSYIHSFLGLQALLQHSLHSLWGRNGLNTRRRYRVHIPFQMSDNTEVLQQAEKNGYEETVAVLRIDIFLLFSLQF